MCADTSPKADAALARLVAAGRDAARMRWSQQGFMRRLPGERRDGRPRNLLGFKDATGNPRRGKDLDRHVWIDRRERTWMLGGTFLVVRRVRVLLERHIADEATWTAPVGGHHVWVTLRSALDEHVLYTEALHAGLMVLPGGAVQVDPTARTSVRLSFSLAPPEQHDEAVRRLAAAVRATRRRQHAPATTALS